MEIYFGFCFWILPEWGKTPPREKSEWLETDEAADRFVNRVAIFSGDTAQCVSVSLPVVCRLVSTVLALVSSTAIDVSSFFCV